MDANARLEFYKNIHAKEFERKDKFEQSISLPITIIFGLSALVYLLISEFDFNYHSVFSKLFLPLLSLTSLSILAAVVFSIFAYSLSGGYRAEPFANSLEQYRLNTRAYYQQVAPNSWETDSQNDFVEYLTNLYISQASDNTYRNDKRGTWIERIKMSLVSALLFSVLSLLPFVINFLGKPEKLYRVDIEHLPKDINTQFNKSQNDGQQSRENCRAASATCSNPDKACSAKRKVGSRRP